MSFAERDLLWLLLLAPVSVALAGWFWRRRLVATRRWVSPGLWERLRFVYRPWRIVLSLALFLLAVAGTTLALAQPRWGEREELVERQGVDVVFVLDSSLSMSASDVPPSRLYVAQALIRSLVGQLPGNRVALVQAEGEGVVMAPLTIDSAVIDLLLDTVTAGSLPTPGTGLAHALRLAMELFPEESEKHRVVVLLTDGEDHEGGLDAAIASLSERGIVTHVLGVGTLRGGPMPVAAGRPNELKRDAAGEVIVTRLAEEPLRRLTDATGGVYLHVTGAGANLAPIVNAIDSMETRRFEGSIVTSMEDRFQWPIGVAVVALAGFLTFGPVTERSRARRRRVR
ncbi:MAG: VWA domain-containing protein [Thermoanaerobaculia bacterium]|nr:VWA domain-containing protein [Thermoanaerobaculia bacterium]